jgi:uncharacterized Zn-binding protein involved in type VI secretion
VSQQKKNGQDATGATQSSTQELGELSHKQTFGRNEHKWGEGKDKPSEPHERQVAIGPVYKGTIGDTANDPEHTRKYSTQQGPGDLSYVSAFNAKGSAEVGSVVYTPETGKLKVVLLAVKAEGSLLHLQTGVKLDAGKQVGEELKRLLFGPAPAPPFAHAPPAPAPMAARIGDLTAHGVPLAPGPGSPNVFIGGLPAWRVGPDIHLCTAPSGHGAGPVTPGAPTVLINGFPAARATDFVVEPMGGPNPIVMGCPTVFIGIATASPAGGSPGRSELDQLVEWGLDHMSGWVLFEATPQLDVVKLEADVKAGVELDPAQGAGKLEAKASLSAAPLKAEVPLKIRMRIPYTDQFLGVTIRPEVSLLPVNLEAGGGIALKGDGKTPDRTLGVKVGNGIVGAGISVSFDVGPAEPASPEKGAGK